MNDILFIYYENWCRRKALIKDACALECGVGKFFGWFVVKVGKFIYIKEIKLGIQDVIFNLTQFDSKL